MLRELEEGPHLTFVVMQVVIPFRETVLLGKAPRIRAEKGEPRFGEQVIETKRFSRETLENVLSMAAILGDFAVILLSLTVVFWIRFQSGLLPLGKSLLNFSSADCYKEILLGSVIAFSGFSHRELYKHKSLLFPRKVLKGFIESIGISLLAFVGVSFVFRTNPPLTVAFLTCAQVLMFLAICAWRFLLSEILRHPALALRLRKRLIVIGGGSQTKRIQSALGENSDLEFVGWVQAIKPNRVPELENFRIGSLFELESVLRNQAIDIAILTESESLQREGVLAIAKACEIEHVQFKMVPHFFEVLISGLCPDVIGDVQVLGVEDLPLAGYRNRTIKRAFDITGALVGLVLSAPLVFIFGLLVYLESPGPIFYKQVRLGKGGRRFEMIKIRSMRPDADADAERPGKVGWTKANDPRRLRVGTFLRKWNVDEVPQFWNVLRGQMSLVGPRPERPELIERFKKKIPHYQARHSCRPGMTGWAQVNGWRGNTDLEQRIRHDIWYVENWDLWLDIRIMFLTFLRRDNAY